MAALKLILYGDPTIVDVHKLQLKSGPNLAIGRTQRTHIIQMTAHYLTMSNNFVGFVGTMGSIESLALF